MFEKEKSVDLSEFGFDKPAIVKRLSAGEKRKLDNDITRANGIEMRGQDVIGKLAPGESALLSAFAYYKEGPFAREMKAFEALDWEVVERLADAGDELNLPLAERKKAKDSLQEPASQ